MDAAVSSRRNDRRGPGKTLLPAHSRGSALQANGIVWLALLALLLTNLVFPKGGTYIYNFPITWGYLAISAMAPIALIGMVRRNDIAIAPIVQATCLFLPIAIIVFYKAVHFNLPASQWIPIAVLFGFFPIAILVAMAPFLEMIRAEDIARAIKYSIRFIVLWGLFNFILYAVSKNFIEIPYLTVNGQDVGMTFSKNNRRGSLMKFVSTYNNGNIFGTCMVMLAPLYFYFERSRIWLGLFLIAVLCTLSRSVWFGLTASCMLMALAGQIKVNRLRIWLFAGIAVCIILVGLPVLGWTGLDDIFDTQLGGRIRYIVLLQVTFFGVEEVVIPEILYFGLLQSFGLIGFVIAMGGFLYAVVYGFMHWAILSPLRRAAVLGAISYLVMAAMDGAFIFPPVFPLFLLINALIYRRGYRRKEDLLSQAAIRHRRGAPPRALP